MAWTIKAMEEKYLLPSAQMVEEVFTQYKDAREGKLVRQLVEEIHAKQYYLPELELIMVDEADAVIGYVMFSRFHLEGRYERELLMLTPAAVKTSLQRQHISKRLIEYGFDKAREMGYKAVLVEGNPDNYRSRGFRPSYEYGIVAGANIKLPRPECLMMAELVPGALAGMHGEVDYGVYDVLTNE